jgi:hypothetical protein
LEKPYETGQRKKLSSGMQLYLKDLVHFNLLSFDPESKRVQQKLLPAQDIYGEDTIYKRREFRLYYVRETLGMPECGWLVTFENNIQYCGCQYFRKFGICIHYRFAFEKHNKIHGRKRVGLNSHVNRGKPSLAGSAFAIE